MTEEAEIRLKRIDNEKHDTIRNFHLSATDSGGNTIYDATFSYYDNIEPHMQAAVEEWSSQV